MLGAVFPMCARLQTRGLEVAWRMLNSLVHLPLSPLLLTDSFKTSLALERKYHQRVLATNRQSEITYEELWLRSCKFKTDNSISKLLTFWHVCLWRTSVNTYCPHQFDRNDSEVKELLTTDQTMNFSYSAHFHSHPQRHTHWSLTHYTEEHFYPQYLCSPLTLCQDRSVLL